MAHKKTDQRVRLTKQMLQSTLLTLMRSKPISGITVKELCAAAGVNRGTFYAHYQDIYALLEEIEEEIVGEFRATLSRHSLQAEPSARQSVVSIYTEIFELIDRHADLCAIVLGNHRNNAFASKLLELGKEKCVSEWMQMYPDAGRKRVEGFYAFVSSGCMGLLNYWLRTEPRLTPQQLGDEVERIVLTGIGCLEQEA